MIPILALRQWLDSLRHPEVAVLAPDEQAESLIYTQYDHGWKGPKQLRRPHQIRALCFHQTGVVFGVHKTQIKAAGGDRRKALHKRFETTPYGAIGLNCGDVLRNNPIERYTYHAGNLNRDSYGVAVEAKHPQSAEDYNDKYSAWDSIAVESALVAGRTAYKDATEWGASITEVWCHSQGSSMKPSDPGELIFRDVIVPLADELDLKIPTTFTRGGRPLSTKWTRHMKGRQWVR